MAEGREYAIVVFGASGFTGQFVATEVAKNSKGNFKWAVAGRNKEKLLQVLAATADEVGRDLTNEAEIILADVFDQDSLNAMCSKAQIVLNCVGPYRFFGEFVVKAAVENKCHHLDVSGEPEYLEKMQLKYHESAKAAGIYVIGTCGFDSVPADMGVSFASQNFPGDLCHVESFMTIHSGPKGSKGHYGTYHSIIYGVASNFEGNLKRLRKELFPNPMPKFGPKLPRRSAVFHSKEVNKWCIPFLGSDASVVRRTQRYNVEEQHKKPVQYGAYATMSSLLSVFLLMFFGTIFVILARFRCGRSLLEKYPRLFSGGFFSHEGPTREQMEETSFTFKFFGSGYSRKTVQGGDLPSEPDSQIITQVTGPEPGYVATPICLVQAAMVILEESLPNRGGVLTPGAAFAGTTLIDRLKKHGVMFSVLSTTIAE